MDMRKGKPVFDDATRFHLARGIERWGWEIGAHTYGKPNVLEPELATLRIGRFCSIGPDVVIALGNHRTDLVSTYPFRALSRFWPEAAGGEPDHETRGDVSIQNDVWIGARVTILSGVTIGHGAVIGANALVREDVPPYAVVAGNPARIVRYRFEPHQIERLLKLSWWDWSDERIRSALPLMMSDDLERFLESCPE
jgi:acetyltransferase-like isoleucine patch superfamily enzyme